MIDIVRERWIDAPPDRIWSLVDDLARYPEWFTFAEHVELLEGTGEGRRQRLHGLWGRKRSEIDQVVTEYVPGRVLTWRHVEERLDGKRAPKFARDTLFTIQLEPDGSGTRVRLESRQEPASAARGVVIRLFGRREVASNMDRSLERLAAAAGAPSG